MSDAIVGTSGQVSASPVVGGAARGAVGHFAPKIGVSAGSASGAVNGMMRADAALAVGMLVVLAVMLLPLPALVLDLLLSMSVALALLVFLFALNIEKPLEFSAFPSLLLLLTLFRLSLNVASTRLILLEGGSGPAAVGQVIRAFGEFVVGGNTVVGIIVFLILVLINFVVITKGAGRISEVAARFTLDAMPGKQMAIDADLAAGLISESEAKERRASIEREADFYGSMDGASKFVRGDAVAGLLITGVNILGGFVVGVAQQGLAPLDAAATYTGLTVGDGLVSQVPALLTSIAAGLVTTRASAGGALAVTMKKQIFGARRPAIMAAGVLGALALVPGMPHLAFLVLSGCLLAIARTAKSEQEPQDSTQETELKPRSEREELEALLPIELLEIEVGYELVPLVDAERDGALLKRIAGVRKQIAQNFGLLVPPIHLRDNLRLRPGGYRILFSGNPIGEGDIRVGRLLAMGPKESMVGLPGEDTTEPAFGLPARWIDRAHRERAEMLGLTVVDAATVAATHLSELLTGRGGELLGRKEVQELLELHGPQHGKVIEELIPNEISIGTLLKVLRNLLKERVSIRDFRSILEGIADQVGSTKDPDQLTEFVRQRLSQQLTQRYAQADGSLLAWVLSPEVEARFRALQNPSAGVLDPNELRRLSQTFEASMQRIRQSTEVPVILAAADIRKALSAFVGRYIPEAAVLSYRELDSSATLTTVGVLGEQAPGGTK